MNELYEVSLALEVAEENRPGTYEFNHTFTGWAIDAEQAVALAIEGVVSLFDLNYDEIEDIVINEVYLLDFPITGTTRATIPVHPSLYLDNEPHGHLISGPMYDGTIWGEYQ